jgi:hypothetical protein
MSVASMTGYLEPSSPAGGFVPINGNTTINNIKTFTTLPQSVAVPVSNADLVNKLYCDTLPNLPFTVVNIPCNALNNLTSNTPYDTFTNVIIPAGTYITLGYIGVGNDSVGTADIEETNAIFKINGANVNQIFGTSQEIIGTINLSGFPFTSNGATTLTLQIASQVATGTWQIYGSGGFTVLNLLKIA